MILAIISVLISIYSNIVLNLTAITIDPPIAFIIQVTGSSLDTAELEMGSRDSKADSMDGLHAPTYLTLFPFPTFS